MSLGTYLKLVWRATYEWWHEWTARHDLRSGHFKVRKLNEVTIITVSPVDTDMMPDTITISTSEKAVVNELVPFVEKVLNGEFDEQ